MIFIHLFISYYKSTRFIITYYYYNLKEQAIERKRRESKTERVKEKTPKREKSLTVSPWPGRPEYLSLWDDWRFRRVKSVWTSMADRGGISFRPQESLVLNPPKPHPQALLLFLQSNQWLITEEGGAGTACVTSAREQTTDTCTL